MLERQSAVATTRRRPTYEVAVARTQAEVEEAQRLRYQVFFEEMGAQAAARIVATERDVDQYDTDCEHLLVRESESGMVVGCYRIMRPEAALRRGAFYSDSEFDLSRLANIRSTTAEVGRACIHPDFRNGATIMLLWSGLARFMVENGYEYVIGCASIPLADGHDNARAVYESVAATNLAPAEYRVFPRVPYPLETRQPASVVLSNVTPIRPAKPHIPALIKGYVRLGAWIGGAPAWDADFNTADLFVLLPIKRMSGAYARHFLGTDYA
ncbi:MAG: GNAT family N-acetyltransferase [Burkholderiales bacterium]